MLRKQTHTFHKLKSPPTLLLERVFQTQQKRVIILRKRQEMREIEIFVVIIGLLSFLL